MEIQEDRWLGLLDNSKSNTSLAHYNILMKGRCSSVFHEYWTHWILLNVSTFAIFVVISTYLEWSYYVKRRENIADWKCRPTKWPKQNTQLNGFVYSIIGLSTASTTISFLTTYLVCGGDSSLYLEFDAYSWKWWIVQWPLIYIVRDYTTYWLHRVFHTRFLYKRFHAYHHRFDEPNPWNAITVHPIEVISNVLIQFSLLFVVPVHWLPFTAISSYAFYHNIIQHSGIDFKPSWWQLWQTDVMFHDFHHVNGRVNFGLSCYAWDKIHGTMINPNDLSSKKSKDPSIAGRLSANK